MARKEAYEKRLQFAAHIFVFTTRDGMIISHLTHLSPLKLQDLAQTQAWKDALLFWGYQGNPTIEGQEFHRQVGLSLTKRSLKKAFQLWKELFGIKEEKKELHRFFKSEVPSIQASVGASNLNREVAVESKLVT